MHTVNAGKNVQTRRCSLECISPPVHVHRRADRRTHTYNDGQIDQSHNLLQITSFHWRR